MTVSFFFFFSVFLLLDDICNDYSVCMMFLQIFIMIIMITFHIKLNGFTWVLSGS